MIKEKVFEKWLNTCCTHEPEKRQDAFCLDCARELPDKTLAEVGRILKSAYRKCYKGYEESLSRKPRENNTERDWKQRLDEVTINYASIFNLSINEAKKNLETKDAKGDN